MGSSTSVPKKKQNSKSPQIKEQDFIYEYLDNVKDSGDLKHFTLKLNKDKTFQAELKDYHCTNPEGFFWNVSALITGTWEPTSSGVKFIVNNASCDDPSKKLTNDWNFLQVPAKELNLQWECHNFKPGDPQVKGLCLNGYDDTVYFDNLPLKA